MPAPKPDPPKPRAELKSGSQHPNSPATRYFPSAVWIAQLWVIPQHLLCKHLHDLTGARASMAGIYEKQAAINILFFNGAKERDVKVPPQAATDRLEAG